MPAFSFHSELSSSDLKNKNKVKKWLKDTVSYHKGTVSAVQFIFCNDEYLLEINRQYLNHDTLTDIITFRYREFPEPLESDIYISVERVRENAEKFSVSFEQELYRVMVHGVLHLLGFKDKTAEQKEKMRSEEDRCLAVMRNE